ncbi:MAG: formate--tetrahydrofolate ligase [Candidatus Bathyarchaeia archaeon]
MKSSVEIAQETALKPITEIATLLELRNQELELYGSYKAKVSPSSLERLQKPDGKLIVVTAVTPTAAGEGKTTTAIGLAQALWKMGKKSVVCLREPSLGPLFGIKGGAAGGGYAQVLPMEDINLHFTGDIHAVTTAHNLLAAMLDNHLFQGNELGIDSATIVWKRALDMNDRALRKIVTSIGGTSGVQTRQDGFEISAASEVMATLCLSTSLEDLKNRLGRIIVGFTRNGEPVHASQLGASRAMALILKDALKPNLVQTIENTPALVHGGPFANIAHGCPSLLAIRVGLKLADYVTVEPGFGSELGAEKFVDILCRLGTLRPDLAVLVASVRALKLQGGLDKAKLNDENIEALTKGLANLDAHLEILSMFGLPVVVAINRHNSDSDHEVQTVRKHCERKQVPSAISEVFSRGGEGGLELGSCVVGALQTRAGLKFLYDVNDGIKEKISSIAIRLYGASIVEYSQSAEASITRIEKLGYGKLPVCIAKTPNSLSDDPKLVGRPEGFTFKVRDLKISAGPGFIVVYAGDIMTMPGLPKKPAAENIDIDEAGRISGLF